MKKVKKATNISQVQNLTEAPKVAFVSCLVVMETLLQTSYIKRIKLFLFLTELSRSLWENLDLGRVYRTHCVRSVLTISVKFFPYRPPTRLIRAKSNTRNSVSAGYPNTEKRAENTTRSGVFLTKFEVFGQPMKHCLECLIYLLIRNKTQGVNGEVKS